MSIAALYNYNHKLCNVPVGIRLLYFIPAFIIAMLNNSILFSTIITVLFFVFTIIFTSVSYKKLVKLYLIPFTFILIGCITIAVSFSGSNLIFSIGKLKIFADSENIIIAQLSFFRSISIISIVFGILLTHSISDISLLMKKAGIPVLFVEIFVLTYKFVNNLIVLSKMLYTAQKCRLAYANNRGKISSFTMLITNIFQQSLVYARNVETAQAARAGNGSYIFMKKPHTYKFNQTLIPLVINGVIISLYIIIKA